MLPHSPHTIILLTDFGLADTYVGQMKGVIISIAPSARIIDLTHAIEPQNIVQGAFLLGRSTAYFPEGSIFVAVVDPGVGSSRKAIALETVTHTFLGPDNGLFTGLLQSRDICSCVTITESRYALPERSSTFHGRDVFAPAAAHLASGVPLSSLGETCDPAECITLPMPGCMTRDNGESWEGSIIYSDHFGNLVTSIESARVEGPRHWVVRAAAGNPLPVCNTYADAGDQQPLAYKGSSGMIEIGVRNGNAKEILGLRSGDPVRAYHFCR
ncbi:MAG: SAM-dependent chlorinase/fluorinase [Chlorobiaceae bacterium]